MDTKRKMTIVAAVVFGIILIAFWGGTQYEHWRQDQENVEIISTGDLALDDASTAMPPEAEEKPTIMVHVTGAVERSGVYQLEEGQRVEDALKIAGIAPDAAIDQLNRAATLTDGQKLVVPNKCDALDSGMADGAQPLSVEDDKISINSADVQTLMRLPGIGEVKAKAIVSYRESAGSFKSLDELKNVSGIGEKTYQGLMDQISL